MSRLHRRKPRNIEFKDAETTTYCNISPNDKILYPNSTFVPSKSYCCPKEGYSDKSTMVEYHEETPDDGEEEFQEETFDIFKDCDANAVMEFTLGNENLQELERIFGDPNAGIQKGIKSVIKIPLVLGEYLYKSYIESERNKQKKFSRSTPNLTEIAKKERKRNYSINEESYHEDSVETLRELAWQHDRDRQKHQEQANYYRSRKIAAAVKMCAERAKLSGQKSREYHELAAAKVRCENSQRQDSKTIDLHRLRVREALQALNEFLDGQIELLNETDDRKEEFVRIVTGKGANSKGGISKVKQAVLRRLAQRKIELTPLNDGFIEAKISRSSKSSN